MSALDGIPMDGAWFRAEGQVGGAPSMIRARQDLGKWLPAATLTTRIIIKWQCRSPVDVGFPSPADYEEIHSFEDTLMNFVQEGAILAFVLTSGGIVEYNLYTSDTSWFMERLNEAMMHKPVAPIEIAAESDPDWSEYRSLMRLCGFEDSAARQ